MTRGFYRPAAWLLISWLTIDKSVSRLTGWRRKSAYMKTSFPSLPLPSTFFSNCSLSHKSFVFLGKDENYKNREGNMKSETSFCCFEGIPIPYSEFLWNNYVFFPKWLNPEKHWTPLQCYSFSDILFALISVGIVGVHWALESRPSSLWQRDYLLTSVFCAAHCSHCKATFLWSGWVYNLGTSRQV